MSELFVIRTLDNRFWEEISDMNVDLNWLVQIRTRLSTIDF